MNNQIYYFQTKKEMQQIAFIDTLRQMLLDNWSPGQPIQILCIGTDKVTGDSLGPFVGYQLEKLLNQPFKKWVPTVTPISIFGTLKQPVHAVNLEETLMQMIPAQMPACTIVVDASLGCRQHTGYVTLSNMPLQPGEGVNKKLPQVGQISITGIVGAARSSSYKSQLVLRQTKLYDLMKLTEFISEGIVKSLSLLCFPSIVQNGDCLTNSRNPLLLHNIN